MHQLVQLYCFDLLNRKPLRYVKCEHILHLSCKSKEELGRRATEKGMTIC